MTLFQFGVVIVKTLLIFAFVMAVMVPLLIWLERRLQGRMQHRLGPNRVGPLGLFQPIADAIKLVLKEDITPAGVSKALYYVAPVLSMVPAFLVFAVIPFGSEVSVAGHVVTGSLADINVALLFLLAMSSLGVYGIVLAGWSSNNKWSLLGAVRSVAQLVSYELPMGFALLGPVLIVGSLSLTDMVDFQAGGHWLVLYQPLAFLVFICAGTAEVNRTPFDLPEAESELVAGFHTEYSSFKFAMFFMAEYANVVGISCVGVTVFLGGWQGPWTEASPLMPVVWFLAKVGVCIFVFLWVRATLPRFRYDRLMHFGWLRLLPMAMIALAVTAIVIAFAEPGAAQLYWLLGTNVGLMALASLYFIARGRRTAPVTRALTTRAESAGR